MSEQRLPWERRYTTKLLISDSLVVVGSVFLAQFLRFGTGEQLLEIPIFGGTTFESNYTVLSFALSAFWLSLLALYDTRTPHVFGTGPVEYRRVVRATLATFATLSILAFILKTQVGRGYLLIALPAGLAMLILCRFVWRKRLQWQRKRGNYTYRTVVMGEISKVRHVIRYLGRSTYAGFELCGMVTDETAPPKAVDGVRVVGEYSELSQVVKANRIDSLIVTAADSITPDVLRAIGWEMEQLRVDMIVAASLTDIAGPRIHMRPVSNLPLIHVDFPKFSGRKYVAKRVFDVLVAVVLLVVLAPVFLVAALLVKISSPGPIFFAQKRVGLAGKDFRMLKFRSMYVNAEQQLLGLLDRSEGNDVLFKIRDDPRVTPVGKIMRRHSIDELPQIINVLMGSMSLVGPRPQLPEEVERYERWVDRRLLVKPGITGLWQVSGRSNLSWEDSVRLDLYYAENWSMVGDLVILARTAKTVITAEGAY